MDDMKNKNKQALQNQLDAMKQRKQTLEVPLGFCVCSHPLPPLDAVYCCCWARVCAPCACAAGSALPLSKSVPNRSTHICGSLLVIRAISQQNAKKREAELKQQLLDKDKEVLEARNNTQRVLAGLEGKGNELSLVRDSRLPSAPVVPGVDLFGSAPVRLRVP